jgi:hypothetical protein
MVSSTIEEMTAGAVTARRFHEDILPNARPVVLRGLVAQWPAVAAGQTSPSALADYLRRFDSGNGVRAMLAPPRMKGRFFYNDDMSGFAFRSDTVKLSSALDLLLAAANDARPQGIAIQSVPVGANLAGFERENRLPLLPEGIDPRVWIGNAVTIAAHYDPSENIACVVGGRRRFTLFPPDQVGNLYPGPFELTPAGPIISMVDFDAPDAARFPGFATAMDHALVAELEPGDAIYIPYLWWHHVRSIDTLNMLVNYWWAPRGQGSALPTEALLHTMLAVRNLPPAHRAAERALFEHFAFGDTAGAHLPEDRRGVQGTQDAAAARKMRADLAQSLGRS